MAEPGDPNEPPATVTPLFGREDGRVASTVAVDADDAVGFTSPAAMAGQTRDARQAPRPASVVFPVFGRPVAPAEPVEGAMWGYTLYALILFAVPTLGVSALIGLLAVHRRAPPSHPVAASHFVFQQRTLWTAALAAVVGLILMTVNIGVFVLYGLALWTLTRGAVGAFRLKAGRPIAAPRGWFI